MKRVLVIRFHAIGDAALTLPACSSFREKYPAVKLDYLCRSIAEPLVSASGLFDHVYAISENHVDSIVSVKKKLAGVKEAGMLLPELKQNKYDVIVDLQNNRLSRLIRYFCKPKQYSEFDRYSPRPAAIRTLKTFHDAGLNDIENKCVLKLPDKLIKDSEKLLADFGYSGNKKLIMLNPAGLFPSRNWPIKNYVSLVQEANVSNEYSFVICGSGRAEAKAAYLKQNVPGLINLFGKTSLAEVLAIISKCCAVISEDSGLMHIAWVAGVPTLALLGSSRADWISPLPPHGASLNSSDLECGNCMDELCRFGDTHCLTRYTADMVWQKVKKMISLTHLTS